MNYRHAFHAGNHTEVFKHSVLVLLLQHLLNKPLPFRVLDTHAGAGIYDLTAEEAKKTGEAREGIGRILDKAIPAASAYLDIVRRLNSAGLRCYPGSPAIMQALLRPNDTLIACELREDDAAQLRANFRNDGRISVHCRDGYEAITAFLPPPARRGLVFIDPPFERPDEFARLADGLSAGIKKWPTGTFMAWHPVKDRTMVRKLRERYLPHSTPTLHCEFIREPLDGISLAGSGVIICNPPWQFENVLTALCRHLLDAFDARKGTYSLDWWIRERS